MMTDPHANFISAILAQPDRDLPRLIYADWLEETATRETCPRCHGRRVLDFGPKRQPGPRIEPLHIIEKTVSICPQCDRTGEVSNGHAERAEFIRVQCELAQLIGDGSRCPVCDWPFREDGNGCQPDNCSFRPSEHTSEHARWLPRQKHFHALRRRERELLHPDGRELAFPGSFWLDPSILQIVTQYTLEDRGYVWRRGFVESLTCSWSDWRTRADAIRRATPLRKVRVLGGDLDRSAFHGTLSQEGVWKHPDYPGIEFELPEFSRNFSPFQTVVAAYPEGTTREAIAEQVGIHPRGGSLGEDLGRLVGRGLVEGQRGRYRARDFLFAGT